MLSWKNYKARSGIEPGISRLSVLSIKPLRHWRCLLIYAKCIENVMHKSNIQFRSEINISDLTRSVSTISITSIIIMKLNTVIIYIQHTITVILCDKDTEIVYCRAWNSWNRYNEWYVYVRRFVLIQNCFDLRI